MFILLRPNKNKIGIISIRKHFKRLLGQIAAPLEGTSFDISALSLGSSAFQTVRA